MSLIRSLLNHFLNTNRLIFNYRLLQSPKSLQLLFQLVRYRKLRFKRDFGNGQGISIHFFITGDVLVFITPEVLPRQADRFRKEVAYHLDFITSLFSVGMYLLAYIWLISMLWQRFSGWLQWVWEWLRL